MTLVELIFFVIAYLFGIGGIVALCRVFYEKEETKLKESFNTTKQNFEPFEYFVDFGTGFVSVLTGNTFGVYTHMSKFFFHSGSKFIIHYIRKLTNKLFANSSSQNCRHIR